MARTSPIVIPPPDQLPIAPGRPPILLEGIAPGRLESRLRRDLSLPLGKETFDKILAMMPRAVADLVQTILWDTFGSNGSFTVADVVSARRMVAAMLDPASGDALADRIDGKPTQKIMVDGDITVRIGAPPLPPAQVEGVMADGNA